MSGIITFLTTRSAIASGFCWVLRLTGTESGAVTVSKRDHAPYTTSQTFFTPVPTFADFTPSSSSHTVVPSPVRK